MKIFQSIVVSIIFAFAGNAIAANNTQNLKRMPAQNCQTLACVRNNIDLIDAEIVNLMGSRLAYVKRAGELKKGQKSIHDPERENKILLKVADQAEKAGYSGSIAAAVFKTILFQSNIYEEEFHK